VNALWLKGQGGIMQNNLKTMLVQRGLSVSGFSRMVGIPQPTMHRIVNSQEDLSAISAEHFLRIAHGLGLSAEQLYYGDATYDAKKMAIDRVFAATCKEGREAMYANAIGVEASYPPHEEFYLPTIREDISAILAM